MEPNFNVLPLDYNPQQKEYSFFEENLKFSSKFDSGNMYKLEKRETDSTYFLEISPDCLGIKQEQIYKTWFFFSIKNFNNEKKKLTIIITNMSNHLKMFEEGYKFVYRTEDLNYNIDDQYEENEEFHWRRFSEEINCEKIDEKNMEMGFKITLEPQRQCFLAFCYPWSYLKNLKFLDYLESSKNLFSDPDIYYDRSLLGYSKEERFLNIITITAIEADDNKQINMIKQSPSPYNNPIIGTDYLKNFTKSEIYSVNNSNQKNIKDKDKEKLNIIKSNSRGLYISKNKPIIFITARVHPGETPGSFLMNGLLKFLTSKIDPRAEILRKAFVFKIIPMINLDGNSRGYFRFDTNSLDMNRHYSLPSFKLQPEIFAVKKVFQHFLQLSEIKFYYDLHAHKSNKGLFLYGNYLDFQQQIENQMLPKLIEINSEHLNFSYCNFNTRTKKSTKGDNKYNKEGTGRVHLQKLGNIIFCYTVEASYFHGSVKNELEKIQPIDFNLLIHPNLNYINSVNSTNIKSEKSSQKFKKEKISEKYSEMNIMDEENPEETPYVTTINDINNNNIEKNNDLDLKKEEDIARKKTFRIESLNLLVILAKYFKIEIDKRFFSQKEIFSKAITQKVKFDEKTDYEKLKNINLNLNSSISSNENFSKYQKSESLNRSFESENYKKPIPIKYIDDKSFDIKYLPKLNTEIDDRKDNLFFDLDEKDNFFHCKVFSEDFSSKNKSLLNNPFTESVKNNNNNNHLSSLFVERNKNKSAIPKKIAFEINKDDKYSTSNNFRGFNRAKSLIPGKIIIEENKNLKDAKKIKDISSINLNINNKNNTSKDIKRTSKDNNSTKDFSGNNILKKIGNFSNMDYEAYSKIMFEEFHYNNKANSLNYSKDNIFSLCLIEEEKFYTPIAYEKMGISLLIAILDYEKLNPFSRLGNTEYKCLEKLRSVTGKYVFNNDEKFNSSLPIQKMMKNINSHRKVISINQKIVEILKGNAKILIPQKKKRFSQQINFPIKKMIISKSPNKTSFGSTVNFDFPKRQSVNLAVDSTKKLNDFIKFSDKNNTEDMNKFIFKFNVARTLMNSNTEIDKKIINSENLFFDGRNLNANANNLMKFDILNSPKGKILLDKIKLNKSGLFNLDNESKSQINKETITCKNENANKESNKVTPKNLDFNNMNINKINNFDNFNKNINKETTNVEMKNLKINTVINATNYPLKDMRNTNYTSENTYQTKETYVEDNQEFPYKLNIESPPKKINNFNNLQINTNLIKKCKKISLTENEKNINKKKLLSSNSIDEMKLFTGVYSSKLRILKGVDLKGNSLYPEGYLNVKCVGLKANFLNMKIIEDEKKKENNKK